MTHQQLGQDGPDVLLSCQRHQDPQPRPLARERLGEPNEEGCEVIGQEGWVLVGDEGAVVEHDRLDFGRSRVE